LSGGTGRVVVGAVSGANNNAAALKYMFITFIYDL
jgi:hypothetical protein